MKSVCVIGAGIGGLSAAIRLANKGFNVTVYEKNNSPGGKANSIEFEGFRFDTGPSLVTMIDVLKELFESVNENIDNFISVKKLDNLCRCFFPDSSVINAYSNYEKLKNEIKTKTFENTDSLDNYFKYSETIFNLTKDIFLFNTNNNFHKFLTVKSLKALLSINKIDTRRTMHEANEKFFSDKRLIQIFDRYATYNGSNPYSAPATLNLISHVENSLGGFYFSNGMISLTNALYKLALKKGVRFHFNSEIKKIITGNKKVISIETTNGIHSFDYYISNIDSLTTNKKFLNTQILNENNLSTSAFVFYWGIEGIHKEFDIHNILFSKDYKKEFTELFELKKIPSDPTIYIYISSKFNKKDAPDNYENWFVMINTPANYGQNWEKEKINIKKSVITKIEKVLGYSINDKIIAEKVLNPEILETQTGSYRGSIYGYSSNTKFSAFLRQKNKSSKYSNLYYCGGSAHPGGGLPLVILSGKNVAENIRN